MYPENLKEKDDHNVRVFLHTVYSKIFILIILDQEIYTFTMPNEEELHFFNYIGEFLLNTIINQKGFYLNEVWRDVEKFSPGKNIISVKGYQLVIS